MRVTLETTLIMVDDFFLGGGSGALLLGMSSRCRPTGFAYLASDSLSLSTWLVSTMLSLALSLLFKGDLKSF